MKTLLLVANYDSGVGYAWWLMESFWAKLAEHYHKHYRVILAYPSISTLPDIIAKAPLQPVEQDFIGTSLTQVLSQCRFLRRYNVSAIYFSDKPTWHWRYLLYRLSGVHTVIVHDHTPGVRTPPKGLNRQLKRLVQRLPSISVDGAIGATDYIRHRLIQVNGLPPDRCHAAPNGLPPLEEDMNASDLHAIFQIPDERKILVMTGRAHRYKGVDFILRCMAYLKAKGVNHLHFLFIGDGPDLFLFKEIAKKLDIADHCTFAGRLDDIPSLLEGADLAMHPSKGEVGYSLSILEYMRAGLPVIVPDNPSVCGATEHGITGLIYPEGNVREASARIENLLRDSDLRDLLGAKAKKVVRRYTLKTTHKALIGSLWYL